MSYPKAYSSSDSYPERELKRECNELLARAEQAEKQLDDRDNELLELKKQLVEKDALIHSQAKTFSDQFTRFVKELTAKDAELKAMQKRFDYSGTLVTERGCENSELKEEIASRDERIKDLEFHLALRGQRLPIK